MPENLLWIVSREGLLFPVLWALRGILISTQQNQVGGLGLRDTPESGVSVSCPCWNKLLQTWWLKQHKCLLLEVWTEKSMATHSSVLAWRISGTGEPGGLPSMGSHRVGHDWSDLAAAAAAAAEVWRPEVWKEGLSVTSATSGGSEGESIPCLSCIGRQIHYH